MAADDVDVPERAWRCAGWRIVESRCKVMRVLVPEGEFPLVLIPRGYDETRRQEAIGCAMARVCEKRYGWLFLVRVLLDLDRAVEVFMQEERESVE